MSDYQKYVNVANERTTEYVHMNLFIYKIENIRQTFQS
jgi:hypothetical protein